MPDKEFLPTKDIELVTLGGIKIKTADEYEAEAEITEGDKAELIINKELIASDEAPTIIKGYNLKFKDNTMRPKLMEILQGGTHTPGDGESTGQKYDGPQVGALKPTSIGDVCVYTTIYGVNGPTGEWIKTTFTNCIGDLVDFKFKGKDYFASEFKIKSRPNAGEPVFKLEVVKQLPRD